MDLVSRGDVPAPVAERSMEYGLAASLVAEEGLWYELPGTGVEVRVVPREKGAHFTGMTYRLSKGWASPEYKALVRKVAAYAGNEAGWCAEINDGMKVLGVQPLTRYVSFDFTATLGAGRKNWDHPDWPLQFVERSVQGRQNAHGDAWRFADHEPALRAELDRWFVPIEEAPALDNPEENHDHRRYLDFNLVLFDRAADTFTITGRITDAYNRIFNHDERSLLILLDLDLGQMRFAPIMASLQSAIFTNVTPRYIGDYALSATQDITGQLDWD